MGSSRRNRGSLAVLILLFPALIALQRPRPLVLAGHLLRLRARDTTLVTGAWVVAHRVGQRRQGPIDSARTDAGGAFRFVVTVPESGAVYVVSTRYAGIGYFSDPATGGALPTPRLDLAVFDTSAVGPPLTVGTRNLVVTRGTGGERRVLDIYQVENGGSTTRVGTDSLAPVWITRLPRGAGDPQPGAGDVPPNAIRFEGGRVLVAAPFPPGSKQVVFTYSFSASATSISVPIDQPTAGVELLLEDSVAVPSGELAAAEPVAIEGHTFRRYSAADLAAGSSFTIRFGDARSLSRYATLFAAVAAGLLLVAGGAFALTRGRRAPAGGSAAASLEAAGEPGLDGESRERLLAQIVALDERFLGRKADTPPAAWTTYQQRRAALKSALARRLARG